jgi:hypothetical protein
VGSHQQPTCDHTGPTAPFDSGCLPGIQPQPTLSADGRNLVRIEGSGVQTPSAPPRRSSRFSRVHVYVWPSAAARLRRAGIRADAPPRFRGNVRRNCVRSLRRVGWPRLTCGRDRNRAASAQVKAKREDLTQGTLGVSFEPLTLIWAGSPGGFTPLWLTACLARSITTTGHCSKGMRWHRTGSAGVGPRGRGDVRLCEAPGRPGTERQGQSGDGAPRCAA